MARWSWKTMWVGVAAVALAACGLPEDEEITTEVAATEEDALSTSVVASADTTVRSGSYANSNFGSLDNLYTGPYGGTEREAFIQFKVGSIPAGTSAVKLVLAVTNSGSGGTLYRTGTFSESSLTWNNKPSRGAQVATHGAMTAGSTVSFDVTSVVTAPGTYAFVVDDPGSDSVLYSSREGSAPPKLVFTYDGSSTSTTTSTLDKFGIKKLYPTREGGEEWFVNMTDPKSDPRFRNWKNIGTFVKQSDGSWLVDADQIRLEAWSPDNKKWLNVEITQYAKVLRSSNNLLQMYSRGGHHSSRTPCEGSAVKARLYLDGRAAWVKEINHPAYTGNRATVSGLTSSSLVGKWVGFKAVIRNVVENGNTYVKMESYIDTDVTDSNGNLVIKNNWRKASEYVDRGGWGTNDSDFESSCGRARDEILRHPGGTATANLAAWRTDGTRWQWKYLSVREIQP